MVIAPIVRQSYGRPHRRSASSSSPALLSRGPQRFFHDTRTYTGVHSSGGPDHANRDSFVLSLRAGQHGHQGSSFSDTPGLQKRQLSDRCSTPFTEADMRSLRGPERFFYDKTTYTGIHARGGPKAVDGPGTWLRPSHNAGSTFTNNSGHPLNNDSTIRLSGSSKSQPVAGARRTVVVNVLSPHHQADRLQPQQGRHLGQNASTMTSIPTLAFVHMHTPSGQAKL